MSTEFDSTKAAREPVILGDQYVGEVWREHVLVVVSKLTEPRRMASKWRWFAKRFGDTVTLGRGTRSSMLLGPGFRSKDAAIAALTDVVSCLMPQLIDNNLLLAAFDDVGGSAVHPMELKVALEKRGIETCDAVAWVQGSIQSGVLKLTRTGTLRLKTKI